MWKDCGYLSLTKDGKKLSVVIKKVRYFVSLTEAKEVLEGNFLFLFVLRISF